MMRFKEAKGGENTAFTPAKLFTANNYSIEHSPAWAMPE
jgi:hypothetical protein